MQGNADERSKSKSNRQHSVMSPESHHKCDKYSLWVVKESASHNGVMDVLLN